MECSVCSWVIAGCDEFHEAKQAGTLENLIQENALWTNFSESRSEYINVHQAGKRGKRTYRKRQSRSESSEYINVHKFSRANGAFTARGRATVQEAERRGRPSVTASTYSVHNNSNTLSGWFLPLSVMKKRKEEVPPKKDLTWWTLQGKRILGKLYTTDPKDNEAWEVFVTSGQGVAMSAHGPLCPCPCSTHNEQELSIVFNGASKRMRVSTASKVNADDSQVSRGFLSAHRYLSTQYDLSTKAVECIDHAVKDQEKIVPAGGGEEGLLLGAMITTQVLTRELQESENRSALVIKFRRHLIQIRADLETLMDEAAQA